MKYYDEEMQEKKYRELSAASAWEEEG